MFTWSNFTKGSIVSMRYSGQQNFEIPDVDVYADEFKSMDNLLIGIELGQRETDNIKQMITLRKSPAHIGKVLIVIWDLINQWQFDCISRMIPLTVITLTKL